MVRLAEVYAAEGHELYLVETGQGLSGCSGATPAPSPTSSPPAAVWLEKAVRLARQAQKQRLDPSLFARALIVEGRALTELGRPEEAAAPLSRLNQDQPNSALVAEAELLTCEGLASDVRPEREISCWLAASQPGSTSPVYALYRLAWAQDRSGEAVAAIRTLERAITSRPPPGEVQDELTRSLIRFYGDAGLEQRLILALTLSPDRAAEDGQINSRLVPPPTSPPVWSALVRVFEQLMARGDTAEADNLALAVLIALHRQEVWTGGEIDAAGSYVTFALDFPRPGLADDALYRAAVIFERHGYDQAASAARRALVSAWPESTLIPAPAAGAAPGAR